MTGAVKTGVDNVNSAAKRGCKRVQCGSVGVMGC